MSWKLVLKYSAEIDLLEGYNSYEERKAGLGDRFISEVEQTIKRIQSNPYLYQSYELGEVRRGVVHKYPYLVFYIVERQVIYVIAILPAAQDPDFIQRRLGT